MKSRSNSIPIILPIILLLQVGLIVLMLKMEIMSSMSNQYRTSLPVSTLIKLLLVAMTPLFVSLFGTIMIIIKKQIGWWMAVISSIITAVGTLILVLSGALLIKVSNCAVIPIYSIIVVILFNDKVLSYLNMSCEDKLKKRIKTITKCISIIVLILSFCYGTLYLIA